MGAEIAHQAIDHIAGFAFEGEGLAHGPGAAGDIADLKIGRPVFARVAENHRFAGAGQKSQMVEGDGGRILGHHGFDGFFARGARLCE